jgi:hypothetical protein
VGFSCAYAAKRRSKREHEDYGEQENHEKHGWFPNGLLELFFG